jgi:type IV pilus assembly protein PilB
VDELKNIWLLSSAAFNIKIDSEALRLVTAEQAWHYNILPYSMEGDTLYLYIDESQYREGIEDELELILNTSVALEKKEAHLVQEMLVRHYRRNTQRETSYLSGNEDVIIKLIQEADALSSSDIHIEAREQNGLVRIRIDGQLVERHRIDLTEYQGVVNRIKIKANLDISEKRLPQDGRIHIKLHQNEVDLRVSTMPTLHGEKVVMRLLQNDASNLEMEKTGMNDMELDLFREALKKPYGIILISGPTGSGKTTSLYAALKHLNKPTTNICTVEDPIEYTLEGVNQVQVQNKINLTFARALKTFLRQDPDVIMVGEIRDEETASIAVRAALTGHLVLSTIHTNNSVETISRLIDMGVPAYLLSSTLNLSIAQRLLRKLCPHCKKKEELRPELLPKLYKPKIKVTEHYLPVGCDACFYTGYTGRKAIFEFLPIYNEFAEEIRNPDFNPEKLLKTHNLSLLSDNAFHYFAEGHTSLEEIYPILMSY